jgi:hypothetical protein
MCRPAGRAAVALASMVDASSQVNVGIWSD